MTDLLHKILINVEDDETRIAMVSGTTLDNLYIEQTHRIQKVGNIYAGTVIKVQPSFQAAFIDYGEERHGFLALSDINFQIYKPHREGRGRPSITQVLRPGQKILVQVIKDEIAHKGASLTTNISMPGRFLVFMPDSDRGGVSRKIEDEEQRTRLRHLLKGLGGEGASAIIRTVGVDRTLTELKRDFMILRRTWNEIQEQYESQPSPKLLYQEENAMLRMIRDYYHEEIAEVVIDEPIAFQRALEFFQAHMPTEQNKLQLYLGEKSLFSTHQIEGQIEVLHHQQVPLPSGGSLVIMPTEALVAIDVNSGRSTQERNIEDTAYRTNMEAATEVARQLRLRNLGGLIVVDFIDMDHAQNRIDVATEIEDSMSADKAKTSFSEISKFGLLEMSRQRISSSLSRNSITLTLANRILRKMQDSAVDQKVFQIHLNLPLELSTHLLNAKRQRLTQLEMDYAISISITPDTLLGPEEIPEMEVTLKTIGGVETHTTVPISAADMMDDKPKRKRGGRRKKPEESLEIGENSIANKEENQNVDKADIADNRNLKSSETSSPIAKPDIPSKLNKAEVKSVPEKVEKDTSLASESDDSKSINQANNSEHQPLKEATENENMKALFTSVHEPIEEDKKTVDPVSLNQNEKETKEETSAPMFNSVHLDDETTVENQVTIEDVIVAKNSEVKLPVFNSVHLDENGEVVEESEQQMETQADFSEFTAISANKQENETVEKDGQQLQSNSASEITLKEEKVAESVVAEKANIPVKKQRKYSPRPRTANPKPRAKKPDTPVSSENLETAQKVDESISGNTKPKTSQKVAKSTDGKAKPKSIAAKTKAVSTKAKTSKPATDSEKTSEVKPKRTPNPRAPRKTQSSPKKEAVDATNSETKKSDSDDNTRNN